MIENLSRDIFFFEKGKKKIFFFSLSKLLFIIIKNWGYSPLTINPYLHVSTCRKASTARMRLLTGYHMGFSGGRWSGGGRRCVSVLRSSRDAAHGQRVSTFYNGGGGLVQGGDGGNRRFQSGN